MKTPEHNENDPLWDLLGNASQRHASPYFTRKVLRDVHNTPAEPGFFPSVALRRWLPISAMAAVVLGTSAMLVSNHVQNERRQAEFNEQFDDLADLDALVAYEDVSLLADGN